MGGDGVGHDMGCRDLMLMVLSPNPDYLTLPLIEIGGGTGCLQMMMIIGRLSENMNV